MFHKILADGFFIFGCIAILAAALGFSTGDDMWLASTQWLEITMVLFLIAIYTKLSEREDLEILKERWAKQHKGPVRKRRRRKTTKRK